MTDSPVDEVVGFDLGHGETAVARVSVTPGVVPQIMMRSQVSAVARLPDGRVVVGEAAVRSKYAVDQHLGFKSRPPGTAESSQALLDFVRRYHEIMTTSHQIGGGNRTHYFFGCPSGWTKGEVAQYAELLRRVLPNVRVVRESRAALVEAKEAHRVSPDRLRSSILVIDMGSLTVNVSCVYGGIHDESLDVGTEIGGHLIEKEILRRAIERSPRRSEILAFFAGRDGEAHRGVCEAHCREAKERYWELEEVAATEGRKSYIPLGLKGLDDLVVWLDREEMESILDAPLPELEGKSWKASLIDFLRELRSKLETRSVVPQVVILTGGASNMSFVPALFQEHFPEAKLVWCTPPEETMALGLARWGRIELQTSAFLDEVREFCKTAMPEIVLEQSEALRNNLAQEIAQAIIADVVTPAVKEWRGGEIRTLNDMNKRILGQLASWIRSPAAVASIEHAYEPILKTIDAEVDRRTYDICRKYDVPHSSLLLRFNVPVRTDGVTVPMETPFDGTINVARVVTMAIMLILYPIEKAVLLGATLTSGPPGWLAAAALITLVSLFGLMSVDEAIADSNVPLSVRHLFLSDAKVNKLVGQATPQLRDKVHDAIGKEEMAKISKEIAGQVSKFLNDRADEVRWIIA